MIEGLHFTGKDVIIVTPFLLGLLGLWMRFEVRMTKQETSMEDLKRLVLNGHGKKRATVKRKV